MDRSKQLWLAAVVCAMAGCATVQGQRGPSAEARLEDGIRALRAGDFATATEQLDWVYRNHWNEPVGQRALLLLTASELDSRNPNRRVWVAADHAARFLGIERAAEWTKPLASVYYLLAQELGAAEARVAQAEAAAEVADSARAEAEGDARRATRGLPQYSGQSVPAQLSALRTERDALRDRVGSLERQLRESQQEIERIRKLLKP